VWPAYATMLDGSLAVEQKTGKARMNTTVITKDFFMGLTSKRSTTGLFGRPCGLFYQHFGLEEPPPGGQSEDEIACRLISLAENASAFRQYDIVEPVSDVLIEWPSRRYKTAGLYYKQLCVRDVGRGDQDLAESLLELVVELDPSKYRARALSSLAAIRTTRKDYGAALGLYLEASRAAKSDAVFDPATVVLASRMVAVCKAMDGSHAAALRDLEGMLPLARMVGRQNPFVYYDYLNSLAVETAKAGRWDEARGAAKLVIASPYLNAYPEWRETYDDIILGTRRRSLVSIVVWPPVSRPRHKQKKVLPMPSPRPQSFEPEIVPTGEPGRVIDFPIRDKAQAKKGKNRMRKPIDPSELADMSTEEKMLMCVEILVEKSGDDRELESVFHELPGDFRARALIELVMAKALKDEELTALLKRLMFDTPRAE
jgi:tetratricopeptide (TPR) repeat protein